MLREYETSISRPPYLILIVTFTTQYFDIHFSVILWSFVNFRLVTGLNAAQAATQTAAASRDVLALIELQAQIKFNGGGHINVRLAYLAISNSYTHA